MNTVLAYVGLGANQGDPRAHLDFAVAALRRHPRITGVRESARRVTRPVGGPPQPDYLNSVVELRTELGAEELLVLLHQIEDERGRVRRERWGPRTLDLDLLVYGVLVRGEAPPLLPHPRLAERLFVLEPLAELAPGLIVPGLARSAAALLAELASAPAGAGSGA